ncbi:MAG: DUF3309 family protein [Rubripirellula sp.]|nr:DUF3309 family protein [Rubripirellula sp.]
MPSRRGVNSRNWGFAPSGGLELIVLILEVLVLLGRFPF